MEKNIQSTKSGMMLFFLGIILVLLLSCLGYSDQVIYIANFSLFFYYCIVFVFTYKRHGFFSVQCLFLVSLCLFSFLGIFLSVVGIDGYRDAQEWVGIIWNSRTTKTISIYYLSFLSIFSFICTGDKVLKTSSSLIIKELKNNEHLLMRKTQQIKLTQKMMYAFFVIALLQKMIEFYISSLFGFASMYAGAGQQFFAKNKILTYLTKGGNLLFELSFYYILSRIPDEKTFNKCFYLEFILTGFSFISGNRSDLVIAIFFFLYYRYKVYGKKIRFVKICLLLFCVLIALTVMSIFRQGEKLSNYNFLSLLVSSLVNTSGSVNVLAYYIQNKSLLSNNQYPFVLDSILRLPMVLFNPEVFNSGQSIAMIELRSNLNHQMTYLVFPNQYLLGKGLGNNFIAEFSEFGIIGVIIGSIFACILIRKVAKQILGNQISIFFSYVLFHHVLYMPRSEAFFDTYTLAKYFLFYFIYSKGVQLMINMKRNHYSFDIKTNDIVL